MKDVFYWERFSKKLKAKIESLRFVGSFSSKEALDEGMRLVVAKGENVRLFWLVDESDGVIADVRFQAYGPIAFLGMIEVASELILRKNYVQVSRIHADLLDQALRDKKGAAAFPKECDAFFNIVLSAIEDGVQQCLDIPVEEEYTATPIDLDLEGNEGGIEGWENFSHLQKKQIIEEVIEKEIRPYIELDSGGVRLIELKGHHEVVIAYEGACTSCYAATGSTLSAIQKILRARVHPSLSITPDIG